MIMLVGFSSLLHEVIMLPIVYKNVYLQSDPKWFIQLLKYIDIGHDCKFICVLFLYRARAVRRSTR